MRKESSTLEKLQAAIERRLLSLSDLRNVPILAYNQSDLESIVQTHIHSGIGVAIVVMPLIPSKSLKHVSGPVFNETTFEVKIFENPGINKAGKSLLSIAEIVMLNLQTWRPWCIDQNYMIEVFYGSNGCEVKCNEGINCFIARFLIPYSI
jgi:hypothetical protein